MLEQAAVVVQGGAMRTIGSIERILVGGIVVVIGAILTVAIKGAGDFDAAQREKAVHRDKSASLAGTPKGGGKLGDSKTDDRKTDDRKTDAKKDALAKSGDPRGAAGSVAGGIPPQKSAANAPANPAATPLTNPSTNPGSDGGTLLRHDSAVEPNDSRERELAKGDVVAVGDQRGTGPKEVNTGNPLIDGILTKQLEAAGERTGGQPSANGDKSADKADVSDAPVVLDEDGSGRDPSKPAAPEPEGTPEYGYEVRSGDTLERIARALYGDGGEFVGIMAANPALADKNTIRTGQVLKLHKAPTQGLDLVSHAASAAASGSGSLAGKTAPGPTSNTTLVAPQKPTSGFARIGTATEHVIAKGDTLMSIALEHYGTKAAWKLIYETNAVIISDKDRIKAGLTLKLPAR